jgi:hypothetical protein
VMGRCCCVVLRCVVLVDNWGRPLGPRPCGRSSLRGRAAHTRAQKQKRDRQRQGAAARTRCGSAQSLERHWSQYTTHAGSAAVGTGARAAPRVRPKATGRNPTCRVSAQHPPRAVPSPETDARGSLAAGECGAGDGPPVFMAGAAPALHVVRGQRPPVGAALAAAGPSPPRYGVGTGVPSRRGARRRAVRWCAWWACAAWGCPGLRKCRCRAAGDGTLTELRSLNQVTDGAP